ncbi:hypothetical protein K432DRAFT_383206 [Lepidopterella palustris CBS 459.81]|uniref:Uncharacterized protein n=1 Tax=Lepidopterella palustris CBS 459.81 TaxID=1314670 RepID=A0A8E2E8P1_9PEZI|nr:hypothetical protein K432DRAFT_383206 [Lepidopterella palustris CBS 459.81]
MKYIAATTLAAILSVASALPTTGTTSANPLAKRTPGSIYMCTGSNWTGHCSYAVYTFNTCHILTAPFYKNIGSFGPDAGALCRITYTADTCTTHGDAFVQTPGVSDLYDFADPATGKNIDAGVAMTSFYCQECSSCT